MVKSIRKALALGGFDNLSRSTVHIGRNEFSKLFVDNIDKGKERRS
jgi:hypothetical protein